MSAEPPLTSQWVVCSTLKAEKGLKCFTSGGFFPFLWLTTWTKLEEIVYRKTKRVTGLPLCGTRLERGGENL